MFVASIQSAKDGHELAAKALLSVFNGALAVTVFFVLSGCVLRLSLDRRETEPMGRTAIGFAVARLIRLYPPVIGCMIFFYLLGIAGIPGFPQFGIDRLIGNASLWWIGMHGPSTTIQGEVLAIPFILAAWILARLFGSAAIAFCIVYTMLALIMGGLVLHLPNMHAWLLPFMVGMAVADPKLRALFASAPPVLWWLAGAAMLACRAFIDASALTALVASILCAGLLVGGLLHGTPGSLHRQLERPALQFLGRISFSLYLLNVPVLNLVWSVSDRVASPHDKPLLAGLRSAHCRSC